MASASAPTVLQHTLDSDDERSTGSDSVNEQAPPAFDSHADAEPYIAVPASQVEAPADDTMYASASSDYGRDYEVAESTSNVEERGLGFGLPSPTSDSESSASDSAFTSVSGRIRRGTLNFHNLSINSSLAPPQRRPKIILLTTPSTSSSIASTRAGDSASSIFQSLPEATESLILEMSTPEASFPARQGLSAPFSETKEEMQAEVSPVKGDASKNGGKRESLLENTDSAEEALSDRNLALIRAGYYGIYPADKWTALGEIYANVIPDQWLITMSLDPSQLPLPAPSPCSDDLLSLLDDFLDLICPKTAFGDRIRKAVWIIFPLVLVILFAMALSQPVSWPNTVSSGSRSPSSAWDAWIQELSEGRPTQEKALNIESARVQLLSLPAQEESLADPWSQALVIEEPRHASTTSMVVEEATALTEAPSTASTIEVLKVVSTLTVSTEAHSMEAKAEALSKTVLFESPPFDRPSSPHSAVPTAGPPMPLPPNAMHAVNGSTDVVTDTHSGSNSTDVPSRGLIASLRTTIWRNHVKVVHNARRTRKSAVSKLIWLSREHAQELTAPLP